MSEKERRDEGRMREHEDLQGEISRETSGDRETRETMDEFEQALTRALRRVDVRAETSAKFLAIAAEAKEHRRRTGRGWYRPASGGRVYVMSRPQAWMGGAIAAMLVLGLFAGEQVHARHEREQAELATQQFETATRVTDHALEQVRAQLALAGIRLQ